MKCFLLHGIIGQKLSFVAVCWITKRANEKSSSSVFPIQLTRKSASSSSAGNKVHWITLANCQKCKHVGNVNISFSQVTLRLLWKKRINIWVTNWWWVDVQLMLEGVDDHDGQIVLASREVIFSNFCALKLHWDGVDGVTTSAAFSHQIF